jgi:cobalt-zinc-cadmium efflux system outer membrane protein
MSLHAQRVLAMAGAIVMATPPAAAGQVTAANPPGLSVSRQQAVDSALAHNPQLRVAMEQVAEARARAVENTAFPDPSIVGDLTGQRRFTQPATNTGSDLELDLSVPFPTKFLLRHRVSNADVRATESAVHLLQQQIASQTAQAYDALLVALQRRDDLQEADSLARVFLAKTEARFEAGSAPRLDVIKARVDAAQSVNDLLANERDVANDRAGLNRLLGRPLGFAIDATDSLVVPDSLPPLDSLEATAQSARPELVGLASQRAGAGAAAALARQYWLPDLDLSVGKNLVQGAPSTYTTTIGFSVPLFFWNHQRGEVAEARHYRRELDAAYVDLEAEVDQDVRTTYAAAATALQQATYLRDDLVPEARRAYDIALVSYGLGGSSALDVLDARRTLLDAEAQLAEALGAANDARADLERAVGVPLDRFSGASNDR